MMYQNTQAVAIIVCILKKASYRCHLNKGVKQTDIKGSVQWKNDELILSLSISNEHWYV